MTWHCLCWLCRQSASLIDIQWDAQNLGEMARFYELVLRTSTQEAGDAYEAVLQQALTQKRGTRADACSTRSWMATVHSRDRHCLATAGRLTGLEAHCAGMLFE